MIHSFLLFVFGTLLCMPQVFAVDISDMRSNALSPSDNVCPAIIESAVLSKQGQPLIYRFSYRDPTTGKIVTEIVHAGQGEYDVCWKGQWLVLQKLTPPPYTPIPPSICQDTVCCIGDQCTTPCTASCAVACQVINRECR